LSSCRRYHLLAPSLRHLTLPGFCGGSTEVGAGSTAAVGLRRTEVGDDLPANWRGLEFRNWGLVELQNCKLSIRGLSAVVGTYLWVMGFWGYCDSWGCWVSGGSGFCEIRLHLGGRPHRTIWVSIPSLFPGKLHLEKNKIFLCTRFPPHGEVGDIRIWGGGGGALQGLLSNLSSPIF
jgi:hypothetical protein